MGKSQIPMKERRPESQEGTRLRARGPGGDPRTELKTEGPIPRTFQAKRSGEMWRCLLPGACFCVGERLLFLPFALGLASSRVCPVCGLVLCCFRGFVSLLVTVPMTGKSFFFRYSQP